MLEPCDATDYHPAQDDSDRLYGGNQPYKASRVDSTASPSFEASSICVGFDRACHMSIDCAGNFDQSSEMYGEAIDSSAPP